MLTLNPFRSFASVLCRRRPAPAPKPHRFYPICDLARPAPKPEQVPND
jgi:hypothetical protein